MATLDSSIVNLGLPTLTKEFSSDLTSVKWVVVVYLIAISCLLLPAGRISDHWGRKKTFVLGFGIFTLGSLFCGLSPSLPALIGFRIFQGIGAALLMSNGPAVITSAFPPNERGGALGTMSMVVSAGLVSGPAIGGILISHVGWRSIFLVNIPVGIAGLFLANRFIEGAGKKSEQFDFDWPGAILQSLALLLFLASFDPPHVQWVRYLDHFTYWRWFSGGLALLVFLGFLVVETRARAPLVDFALLRIKGFWMPNLAGFLTFVAYSAVSVLMPFFLEEELLYSPSQAGILMTAVPLTIFVIAPLSGRVSDRIGNAGLSVAGGMVGGTGLLFLSGIIGVGLGPLSTPLQIVLGLCSIGLATGLFQSPNNSAIMSAVPVEKLGIASAFLATVRNLGLVLGTGLSTALFSWRLRSHGSLTSALHFTLSMAAGVAFMASFVSFARRKRQ